MTKQSVLSHFAKHKQMYLLWMLAFGVRFIWWIMVVLFGDISFSTYDTTQFELLAHNLITHSEFSRSLEAPFFPDFARTPGYPLFLAAFKALQLHNMWIALIQLALCSLVPLQLLSIAKKYNLHSPIFTYLVLTFDLSLVLFTPMILSDGLFFFGLSTLLYLILAHPMTSRRLIWIALLAGALILIRPIAIAFPLLVLLFIWRSKQSFRHLLTFAFVVVLLPLGWSARNYHHFSLFSISTMSSNNLLFYNAAGIEAEASGRSFAEVQNELAYAQLALQDWEGDPMASKKYVAQCTSTALEILSTHPLSFAKQIAHSIGLYFIKPPRSYFDQVFNLNYSYAPIDALGEQTSLQTKFDQLISGSSVFALIMTMSSFLMNLIVFMLAAVGAWFLFKTNPQLALLLVGGALYFCFLSVFTATDSRFRLPAIPFLALLAAAAPIRTRLRGRQN